MKRIVQCPKCEAKLSVFDSGKPISQKCPKCANTFEVTPEGAANASPPESQSAPPPAAAPETTAKEKPASAPTAQKPSTPVAQPEPVIVEGGVSFLHVLVICALLFTIIVVQVVTFKKTEAHLKIVSDQVSQLQKKISTLN